jgi:superoxide dismutase, Cu-Zn family
MRGEIGAAALAALVLGGCQLFAKAPEHASATLQPTRGSKVTGEVTFQQAGDRVRMVANVAGLSPNSVHGFHIHEVGDCSAPDGSSAKSHFNPYGKPHGRGPERHAGDLPALKADARGRATLTVDLDIVTLARGPADIVGRSVVVHAKPDDYATQPTGNTGARLACGVIRAR